MRERGRREGGRERDGEDGGRERDGEDGGMEREGENNINTIILVEVHRSSLGNYS